MIHAGTKLYSEIDKFTEDMHRLVERLKAHNSLENKQVRDSLRRIVVVSYKHYRTLFLSRSPASRVARDAILRHNYSISQLRREYQKLLKKIDEQFK